MRKFSFLLIVGFFIIISPTLKAQINVSGALNRASKEIKKSSDKKDAEKKAQAEQAEKEKALKEQEEQEKAKKEQEKDHPLVSRFEGAEMKFYKETKWGSYKLPVSDKGTISWGNPMALEGKVTRIQYTVSNDNNSEFVLHNYKSAFNKSGFEILIAIANEELGVSDRPHTWNDKYYVSGGYYNGLNNGKFGMGIGFPTWNNKHCFIAARGHDADKDVYAIIYTIVTDKYTLITQDVVEVEAVETGMVSAANISKDISAQGYIAIYDILFETGKTEINLKSAAALKNIAEFLNANKEKQYLIVGHTDNVGDFEANMKLSTDRANVIVNELVEKYNVNRDQLSPAGAGSMSPVASNSTNEGKSKNRRVEIVEK